MGFPDEEFDLRETSAASEDGAMREWLCRRHRDGVGAVLSVSRVRLSQPPVDSSDDLHRRFRTHHIVSNRFPGTIHREADD